MPRYQIYYARNPSFRPSGEFGMPRTTVTTLPETHILLCEIEADGLDDAFWRMQGENWSPRGEARSLLERLGLHHTSMSVGDVIQDEHGFFWECLNWRWKPVPNDRDG